MSNSTVKATRATVFIGGIEIRAYVLPNGDVKLAGRNVTDAVAEPANSLVRGMGVKSLKALPGADLSLLQVKADTGESLVPVAVEDAVQYWAIMAGKGNAQAMAIITALAVESIERRVDRALGIQRSEEERDARLALRVKRVDAFQGWTECLKDYQVRTGIYGTPKGKQMFADTIRLVNMRLFGQPHFNCDRDTMTMQQQMAIESFEVLLKRRYSPGADAVAVVHECLDFFKA